MTVCQTPSSHSSLLRQNLESLESTLELKGTLGGHIVHLLCNEQGLTARSGSSEPGQPDLENVVRK